jgi:hypothetical protein
MRYGVWIWSNQGLRTAANAIKLFWSEEAADRYQDEMTEQTGTLHVSGKVAECD